MSLSLSEWQQNDSDRDHFSYTSSGYFQDYCLLSLQLFQSCYFELHRKVKDLPIFFLYLFDQFVVLGTENQRIKFVVKVL